MPEFCLFRSLGVASVAGGRVRARSWFAMGAWAPLGWLATSAILSYLSTDWVSSHLRPIVAIADAYGECGCGSLLRRAFATQPRRNFSENFSEDGEGTTAGHDSAIPRLKSPRLCMNLVPRSWREQGMPGARCTRGLVCNSAYRKRTRAYRYSRNTPAFPAQWSYGLCRALLGDEFVLSPSLAN